MKKQGPCETQNIPPAAERTSLSPRTRRVMLADTVAMSVAAMAATVAGASAQTEAAGLQTNPADESIRLGPLGVRFLLTGEHTGDRLAVFEVLVPGAQRLAAPAHSHDRYEETIYGIDGVLTWTVEGEPFDVGPGQALCIPRGAVHRFDNRRSADAKALCVVTPAAIGPEYFRESAAVINAAKGGPPDVAKMLEVMRRHGITPAMP